MRKNITFFQVMTYENIFGIRKIPYWIGFITNESNI